MLVSEAIAHYLKAGGIEVQFGVLGEGNIAISTALDERGVPLIHARREDAAVSMADGWARRSRKIGLASVTHGPGVTNTVTSLVEAARHGTPLVLLTAVTPRADRRHPQWIPARTIIESTGTGWVEVRGGPYVAEDVATAFRCIKAEKRPYALAVPANILYEEVDELFITGALPEHLPGQATTHQAAFPEPDGVDEALRLLEQAKQPLLLAGAGAVDAGAKAAIEELGRLVGAKLATTLLANGLFSGNGEAVGICGSYATRAGAAAIQASDLVVAFGCSLNTWTTMNGELFEGTVTVQCDSDPRAIGRWLDPDLALIGDARSCAQLLCDRARELGVTAIGAELDERQVTPDHAQVGSDAQDQGLSIPAIVHKLQEVLPERCVLAFDAGHCVMDPVTHLEPSSPERFIFPIHAAAIGLGLGTAIGAASFAPDEWTILIAGDGGLFMSLQELDTLRRLQLPLIIVVLDDEAYGAEVHYCAVRGLPDRLAYTDNGDFVDVARGFGISAQRITALSELDILKRIIPGPKEPWLLHVPLDTTPMNDWYQNFSAGIPRIPSWTGGQ